MCHPVALEIPYHVDLGREVLEMITAKETVSIVLPCLSVYVTACIIYACMHEATHAARPAVEKEGKAYHVDFGAGRLRDEDSKRAGQHRIPVRTHVALPEHWRNIHTQACNQTPQILIKRLVLCLTSKQSIHSFRLLGLHYKKFS